MALSVFRRERRRRFPGAAANERREEIKEGLASYTGVAAWADSPADRRERPPEDISYRAATLPNLRRPADINQN